MQGSMPSVCGMLVYRDDTSMVKSTLWFGRLIIGLSGWLGLWIFGKR